MDQLCDSLPLSKLYSIVGLQNANKLLVYFKQINEPSRCMLACTNHTIHSLRLQKALWSSQAL